MLESKLTKSFTISDDKTSLKLHWCKIYIVSFSEKGGKNDLVSISDVAKLTKNGITIFDDAIMTCGNEEVQAIMGN